MLETKKEIEFKSVDAVEVTFGNEKIKVKPYLSMTDQVTILTVYLEEYFSNANTGIINSEFKLIMGVLDYCTDINVDKLSLNDIMANYKLWKEINSKIVNYGDFRAWIAKTIDEIREQKRLEKSLGNVVEKILEFISNLKDVSPEMLEQVKSLLADVEGSKIYKQAISTYKQ